MPRSLLLVLALLGGLLLVPLLLRERADAPAADALRLVVVTPHNEAIRYEFERAFSQWHQARFGRAVDIDWRTPGGASEISRYLVGAYTAAFRDDWRQTREDGGWSEELARALLDRKLDPKTASPRAWEARQAFLAGNTGIGIDLVFGGGQYDSQRLADMGLLVPSGLRAAHPDWFSGPEPLIPGRIGGEVWADPQDRYVGVCLTAFGICANLRRWEDAMPPGMPPPTQWNDLGNPRLAGLVGAGDPSKSGSIAKAFEMLVQQQMALAVARRKPASPADLQAALDEGWRNSMRLVKEIGANARYFTNSAGKVPSDVAAGDAAAGMCIDFYGRFQAGWEESQQGVEVVRYVTPAGGSSVSADPVGLLRGAPNRETAARFLEFLFSREGQRLWSRRVGAPDGPVRYALWRLPIRRDLYGPEERTWMSDPAADPYELAASFTYHPEWTGPAFNLMRLLIRVMVIDCHGELVSAQAAIRAAGGPEAVPEAQAAWEALPFSYAEIEAQNKVLKGNRDAVRLAREWAGFFREHYGKARMLAEARPPAPPSRSN